MDHKINTPSDRRNNEVRGDIRSRKQRQSAEFRDGFPRGVGVQRRHQRQQQGVDVVAVDVGVDHQHDLVVAQLVDVELFVDAGAERGDDRLDLGVAHSRERLPEVR